MKVADRKIIIPDKSVIQRHILVKAKAGSFLTIQLPIHVPAINTGSRRRANITILKVTIPEKR